MSIAAQLEANLRDRVSRNLDQSRTVLVQLIIAPLNQVSGQLANGVMVDVWADNGDNFTTTARSLAPYSLFVEFGTGIYGPIGSRITPKTAKALHFYWNARGGFYTFRSVRGSPPLNFFYAPMADNLESALNAVWSA